MKHISGLIEVRKRAFLLQATQQATLKAMQQQRTVRLLQKKDKCKQCKQFNK
jgi:hypothetical protein